MSTDFLTISQVARELQCSYKTVQRAIQKGLLPCYRVQPATPRIPRAALDRCLNDGSLRNLTAETS